jgi:hypothetical protein
MKKHIALVSLASLLAAVACNKHDKVSAAGEATPPAAPSTTSVLPATALGIPASLAKLTPNERKWGISPTRNDKVTYQPDVILMEHGADAVRAMASNGLTWTIDANAPHADEIKVDKILFATGRVVGRVLAVTRSGDNLAVTLGPFELTDVIRDCDISATQAIDSSSMLVYTAPDYPGATTHDDPEPQATTMLEPAAPYLFASYKQPLQEQDSPAIDELKTILIDSFLFIPECCNNIGVKLENKGKGPKMKASAVVLLGPNKKVIFDLVIHAATIYTASVELQGVTGFRVAFEGATAPGTAGEIRQNFFLPVDWVFPIQGIGVPFSIVFRQTLSVTTLFTAQSAQIKTEGEYAFSGSFFAGKKNGGSWGANGPSNVTTVKNLASNLEGVSVGVNGLVFAYGAKAIAGIGAFGFVTGPFVGYNTSVGVNKGSSMTIAMLPSCRSADYDNSLKYGVGYQMPKLVVKAINIFLHVLNIKPVEGEGGVNCEKQLAKTHEFYPANCDAAAAT